VSHQYSGKKKKKSKTNKKNLAFKSKLTNEQSWMEMVLLTILLNFKGEAE
jgi:hypothetical protein